MNLSIIRRLNSLFVGRWIDFTLVAFAALAWGSTFVLLARGALQPSPTVEPIIFSFGVISFWVMVKTLGRTHIHKLILRVQASGGHQLALVLLLGIALRLVWIVVLPASPASDGATYVSLAHKLLAGEGYETGGTYAYWPPGYPLFLAVWFFSVPATVAVPLSQVTLYVIGSFGIYRLTQKIVSENAAIFATLLFATWPNLIALSSTPEKEALVLAILPWVVFWGYSRSKKRFFLAGVTLGFAVLTQPSLQLLIPALGVLVIARNGLKSLPQSLILIMGCVLSIAPWTIRNYQILGEFKLVGTNGGDVLYRANNPLATGGYTDRGEIDLSHLGELELDKKSRELAIRWIRESPGPFMSLVFEKQIRYMGDDSVGVYATFRSDADNRDNRLYAPLKLIANAWWLLAWLIIGRYVMMGRKLPSDLRFLMWGWFYLFVLHSVFESASKYHVPMTWLLCIALSSLLLPRSEKELVVNIT